MNTSFDTFISPLLSLIDNKLLLFIVVFIITVASLYYIKHKAKSGFSISDRFWIFWTGHKRKEGSDLIDDIIEIEKFNYHYNTNAVSKREKVQFENWVRKYELDFKLLSKLKGYFSIDILKVKKVKTRWSLAAFLLIFVPFFLLWGSLMVALKPAGLIKMKETSWFWLNKNEAAEYNYFGGKNEGG
ncbi:DUF6216 family protein [Erwinia oleae]|uniref:DUF6216 family protein n=1 Tax=Erwinia oleae TaxID=796334 RepID=UPI000557415E|nr:DUF6216 family protein [Erwinia oleae]